MPVPLCQPRSACPSFHGCPVCPVVSWQSCFGILVPTDPLWQTVLPVIFCMTYSACPVMPIPCCTAKPLMFWIFRSGSPILIVLFWLSFSDCPVLAITAILFWPSSPGYPALANMLQQPCFCCLSCRGCPLLLFLFSLSWSACRVGCPILAVLFVLSFISCLILAVLLFRLSVTTSSLSIYQFRVYYFYIWKALQIFNKQREKKLFTSHFFSCFQYLFTRFLNIGFFH